MQFAIPDTVQGYSLTQLAEADTQAREELASLIASVDPDTVTEEQVEQATALRQFVDETIPAARTALQDRAARFAILATPAPTDKPDCPTVPSSPKKAAEDPQPVVAASAPTPSVAAIAADTKSDPVPAPTAKPTASLIAAADVPGYPLGHTLNSLEDLGKAFLNRTAGFGGRHTADAVGEVHYPFASLMRDYPVEFSVYDNQDDQQVLERVAAESRLPGGSLLDSTGIRAGQSPAALTAAGGWCAPSEVDYSIFLQISTDGLADFPEVQARRGGIRHNTGIDFSSVFGSGTGYFNLTEAQVAAGTTKTCLEVDCPSFIDTRLGVTGLCLTGNILSTRGYPEYIAKFVQGAMAASAHQINREQIAAVVADSTAVNLTAAAPWATDGTVVSQVLSAVEMAVVDIRYRMRLAQSATLELVLPFWVLAQARADWVRRNGYGGINALNLADADFLAALRTRGVRPQFVYDWQDAFATGATSGSPGSTTPISSLPNSLKFLIYPAGTWVRAVSDVITLNAVYDSTKLATNQYTHLFTETGWAMVRMAPLSRVYTVGLCPSGATTATHSITCP